VDAKTIVNWLEKRFCVSLVSDSGFLYHPFKFVNLLHTINLQTAISFLLSYHIGIVISL